MNNSLLSPNSIVSWAAKTPREAVETEIRRRALKQTAAAETLSIEGSKAKCKTLAGFIREAWEVVEPGTPLVWGWHIDVICQHLEAVTYGQITRLLINVPPGTMKSLIVSVFWPAWEWGPAGLAHLRYYTTSFKDELVTRDTRKMRDLVFSPWFQERWPHVIPVRGGESNFSNTALGWRIGSAWTSLTGERGHRLIIDDPHSTEGAESKADRDRAVRIFRESAPSRIVDPQTSAIIVVMQRLHTEDISGVALTLGDYVHLMLPMEFEPDRRCETVLGFKDPRTYDGELLFPERFTRATVDRDKAIMGSFAVAGQYQQRPTQRDGGLFKRAWFNKVKAAALGTRWVRYWDLAATKDQLSSSAAYTAGVLLGRQPNGRYVIGDVARLRAEGVGVRRLIRDTARDDGPHIDIGIPQDPGQAGKAQAQSLVAMLAQYSVKAVRESGDKITRAEPIASQAEAGLLDIVEGDWNEAFIAEACEFPSGKFKDQVDALSGAYAMLIGANMFTTPEDHIAIPGNLRILDTWPRVAAMDVSQGVVSMVWGAYQPSSGVIYIYDCLSRPRSSMAVHASAAGQRKTWIPMLFDMFDQKRADTEAHQIIAPFNALGIEVYHVPLDMEGACQDMQTRFDQAQLRVFENLTDWFGQYRRLARDEKGEIADAAAGILRATGLLLSGITVAVTEARAASDARGYDPSETYDQSKPSTGY